MKPPPDRQMVSWGLIYLLSLAAGVTVANIYYNQPLLADFARSFHISESEASRLSVATQIGYAGGLLILVPLGDILDRRKLILLSAAVTSMILLLLVIAPSLPWMILGSLALGFTSITPQLIVPYAAALAHSDNRGHVVGSIMGGLFVGILFSRVMGGFIDDHFGWKVVLGLGSLLTFLIAFVLFFRLPQQQPASHLSYRQLLGSLLPLWAREPVLRRHALLGALGFGAFSVFWTTLAFYLADRPEHFGGEAVGCFGLVALAGAAIAPLAGRWSDRSSARLVNGTSLLSVVIAFALMLGADKSLLMLAAGVLLMDAGVQANQISNQTRIYALAPELRNRITSIYMFIYFSGGAMGSAIGAQAWALGRWTSVCLAGASLAAIALIVLFTCTRTEVSGTALAK